METQEPSLISGENVSANQETTPKVETPTTEEKVKSLQTELETIRAEKIKVEDSYKGLQRTLNKTNDELKRQVDLKSELSDLREQQRLQAALIAEYLNKPEETLTEETQARKPDLLKSLAIKEKELEQKRAQKLVETQRLEYNRQADELWSRASALGLSESDDNLLDIEDYLKAGNLKRAYARLTKLEGEKKPVVKQDSQESEDVKINRLVQERLNKAMEEKGLLKTDTPVPSGRSGSKEDIIKRYAEGDPSVSEIDYLKATGRG